MRKGTIQLKSFLHSFPTFSKSIALTLCGLLVFPDFLPFIQQKAYSQELGEESFPYYDDEFYSEKDQVCYPSEEVAEVNTCESDPFDSDEQSSNAEECRDDEGAEETAEPFLESDAECLPLEFDLVDTSDRAPQPDKEIKHKSNYKSYFAFPGAYSAVLKAVRMLDEEVASMEISAYLDFVKEMNRHMPQYSWELLGKAQKKLKSDLKDKSCVTRLILQEAMMNLLPGLNASSQYEKEVVENYAKMLLVPGMKGEDVILHYPKTEDLAYDKFSWTVANVLSSCSIPAIDPSLEYFPPERKCALAEKFNRLPRGKRMQLILVIEEANYYWQRGEPLDPMLRKRLRDIYNTKLPENVRASEALATMADDTGNDLSESESAALMEELYLTLSAVEMMAGGNEFGPTTNLHLGPALLLTLLTNPDAVEYDPRLRDFASMMKIEVIVKKLHASEMQAAPTDLKEVTTLLGESTSTALFNQSLGQARFLVKRDPGQSDLWILSISSGITGANLMTLNHTIMMMTILNSIKNLDVYFKGFTFYVELLSTQEKIGKIKTMLPQFEVQIANVQRLLKADEATVAYRRLMSLTRSEHRLLNLLASPEAMTEDLLFVASELETQGNNLRELGRADDASRLLRESQELLDYAILLDQNQTALSATREAVESGLAVRIVRIRMALLGWMLVGDVQGISPEEKAIARSILEKKAISRSELTRLRRYFALAQMSVEKRQGLHLAHGIRRSENQSPQNIRRLKDQLDGLRKGLKANVEDLISTRVSPEAIDETLRAVGVILDSENVSDPTVLAALRTMTSQLVASSDMALYELKRFVMDIDSLLSSIDEVRHLIQEAESSARGGELAAEIRIPTEPLMRALSRLEDASSSLITIERDRNLGKVGEIIAEILNKGQFYKFAQAKIDVVVTLITRLFVAAAQWVTTGPMSVRVARLMAPAVLGLKSATGAAAAQSFRAFRAVMNSKAMRIVSSTPFILATLALEVGVYLTMYSMVSPGLTSDEQARLRAEVIQQISVGLLFASGGVAMNKMFGAVAVSDAAAGGGGAAVSTAAVMASPVLIGAVAILVVVTFLEIGNWVLPKYIPSAGNALDLIGKKESDVALVVWSYFSIGQAQNTDRILANDQLVDFGIGMAEGETETLFLGSSKQIIEAQSFEELNQAFLFFREEARIFAISRLSYLYSAISAVSHQYFSENKALATDVERFRKEFKEFQGYTWNFPGNAKSEFGLNHFTILRKRWGESGIPTRIVPYLQPIQTSLSQRYAALCGA